MSISTRLKDYLDREGVSYRHRVHPTAYTAQEIAAVVHVPGRELAKTVVLKADDRLVMAVLSANDKVDVEVLKNRIGCKSLLLATEEEFRNTFPTCETGAMPPLGNIFGLRVYCDAALERDRDIEFNAGTHHDTIRMKFGDFKRLAVPELLNFRTQREVRAA